MHRWILTVVSFTVYLKEDQCCAYVLRLTAPELFHIIAFTSLHRPLPSHLSLSRNSSLLPQSSICPITDLFAFSPSLLQHNSIHISRNSVLFHYTTALAVASLHFPFLASILPSVATSIQVLPSYSVFFLHLHLQYPLSSL